MLSSSWDLLGPSKLLEIDDAIVEMERTGFLLDTGYCDRQLSIASNHEAEQLENLYRWVQQRGYDVLPGGVKENELELVKKQLKNGTWKESVKKKVVYRRPDWMEEKNETNTVWTSPTKLRRFLHSFDPGALGLPPSPIWKKGKVKIDRGEVKIDEAALDWLAARYPEHRDKLKWIINLRRIRGCMKYLRKLPTYVAPDGRIHPVCGPAGDRDDRVGAVTWRLAMKNPEGQQIPSDKKKDVYRIRKAFIAGPGNVLIVADYSALEVVGLAHICKVLFNDDQLAKMVAPGAPDIHSTNARQIFGSLLNWTVPEGYPDVGKRVDSFDLLAFKCPDDMAPEEAKQLEHPYAKYLRGLVKTVWYGLQYGKGAYGFGASMLDAKGNPIGEERAGQIVEGLLRAVPALRWYQDWVREFITEHAGIAGLNGAWCDLSELINDEADDWQIQRAWRRALNFPLQNFGAVVVGMAMVAISKDPLLRKLGFKTILQVHDELVLEGPLEFAEEAKERVRVLMTTCFPLSVPLQVSAKIGPTWEEAK